MVLRLPALCTIRYEDAGLCPWYNGITLVSKTENVGSIPAGYANERCVTLCG